MVAMDGERDPWRPVAMVVVVLLAIAGVLAAAATWRTVRFESTLFVELTGGGVGLAFALWMLGAAEQRWAGRCYFLAGVGFYLSAITWAVEPLPTDVQAVAVLIGVGGVLLFYGGFVAMFLGFPRPLLPARRAVALLAVALVPAAWAVAMAARGVEWPLIVVVTAAVVTLVALILVQAWLGRRDARVRLRSGMLAVVVVLGGTLHLLVYVLGYRLFAAIPLTLIVFPVNTLIFIGLGLTAGRLEPFAAGGWAARLMMAAALAVASLLIAALLLLATGDPVVAIALAFATVACGWLPFRLAAAHRAERRRAARARDMLERAASLAFGTTPETLEARWHGALRSLFDPVAILPAVTPVAAAGCAEDGVALHLPGFRSLGPVVCRHADQGRRLFVNDDVEMAESLIHVLDQLIAGRDNYVRGREAEREKIARDLHDDVNGLLVTSLLRDDAETMRRDVRGALSEIRGIVRGASASNRSLASLLAELRHEAATRLEVARIAFDWSATATVPDLILDPARYRHILSIVRESITNVLRHAGASRVWVEIDAADDWLTLTLVDDGGGAPTDARAGSGLANGHRRAELVGGTFAPIPVDTGFAVRLRMPLDDRPTAGHPPVPGY